MVWFLCEPLGTGSIDEMKTHAQVDRLRGKQPKKDNLPLKLLPRQVVSNYWRVMRGNNSLFYQIPSMNTAWLIGIPRKGYQNNHTGCQFNPNMPPPKTTRFFFVASFCDWTIWKIEKSWVITGAKHEQNQQSCKYTALKVDNKLASHLPKVILWKCHLPISVDVSAFRHLICSKYSSNFLIWKYPVLSSKSLYIIGQIHWWATILHGACAIFLFKCSTNLGLKQPNLMIASTKNAICHRFSWHLLLGWLVTNQPPHPRWIQGTVTKGNQRLSIWTHMLFPKWTKTMKKSFTYHLLPTPSARGKKNNPLLFASEDCKAWGWATDYQTEADHQGISRNPIHKNSPGHKTSILWEPTHNVKDEIRWDKPEKQYRNCLRCWAIFW